MESVDIFNIILWSTAIISSCILGSILIKKYLLNKMPFGNSAIRVLSVKSISPQHKLALVDFAGKRILIGYTKQYIAKLDSINIPKDSSFKAELYNQTVSQQQEEASSITLKNLKNKVSQW